MKAVFQNIVMLAFIGLNFLGLNLAHAQVIMPEATIELQDVSSENNAPAAEVKNLIEKSDQQLQATPQAVTPEEIEQTFVPGVDIKPLLPPESNTQINEDDLYLNPENLQTVENVQSNQTATDPGALNGAPESNDFTNDADISNAQEGNELNGINNQQQPDSMPNMTADKAKTYYISPNKTKPSEVPSLLFTYWEQTALKEAKTTRGPVRAPTNSELNNALNEGPIEFKDKPRPEERDISLGGIVYKSGSAWTIWLNGQRINPKALPKEALELVVYKHHIELKWFDEYTNQIFPIRLRAHQRFNLDTRMFLPG